MRGVDLQDALIGEADGEVVKSSRVAGHGYGHGHSASGTPDKV